MVVGFFELRLSGILRFPLWLYPGLTANCSDLTVVYFYEHADCDIDEVNSRLPGNASIVKVTDINKKAVLELLSRHHLDRLVVMAQRIPDSCLVVAAKSLFIPTTMYQHGLYVPFMKRQGSLFVANIFKTWRFIQYAMTTADIIRTSRCILLLKYIRTFVLGHPLADINFPMSRVNTDSVLVYGGYWKDYHRVHFGYQPNQQFIVGAPDFSDVSQLLAKQTIGNSVCYIAQTLVEDGRLPRGAMLTFISNLAKAVTESGLQLKVRLHPRSDLSLYQSLPADSVLSKTDFPKSTAYVGHYSSILAKSTFMSNHIILVDFPDHEIPDYIAMLADKRINYDDHLGLLDGLKSAIRNGVDLEAVATNIEKQDFYFDSSISNPLEVAALRILKQPHKEEVCC